MARKKRKSTYYSSMFKDVIFALAVTAFVKLFLEYCCGAAMTAGEIVILYMLLMIFFRQK